VSNTHRVPSVPVGDQRCPGIEADERFAGDQPVVYESWIEMGVRDDQRIDPVQGTCAERRLTFGLAQVDAQVRLEPLPVGVDQTHEGHRRAAQLRREPSEVVERPLRLGVQHTEAV
jgi:hypothetical protein